MADWITEGVSARSPWGITDPVIHLLVTSANNCLWCSGGNGRPEVHHPNSTPTGRSRFCRECRALAQSAVNEGTLSISDVKNWRLREPAAGRHQACPCCVQADPGLVCQSDLGGQCGRVSVREKATQ